jgi:hypothetical protein
MPNKLVYGDNLSVLRVVTEDADNCRVTEKAGLALGEVFTDCPSAM